ncbi:hypothetical protein SAMN06269185_2721 [Natronoarchaeum philippinense]|uniref:DUF7511 domain-containing protein n=1 Tax=Natronoarchaeum philippinense TaxID=558529 RepID=A0A285P4J8_NATPI|nr:hypothetical protein [Natronoarchaeum philippinense]SNZ16197.1 hypothetical protein SAMN06269185_2721 [Natronoarchaeum philippinense]
MVSDDLRRRSAPAPDHGTAPDASARTAIERVRARDSPVGLCHEVVAEADGPDRCTIFPPDATGVVKMSTWLTADADAFVDLSTVR